MFHDQLARHFLVIVHDVAPPFLGSLQQISAQLRPLIGNLAVGAVVPCWHGTQLSSSDAPFIGHTRTAYSEVLLHGYMHHSARAWGPVALLTSQANEFTDLTPSAAVRRIQAGQADIANCLGVTVRGFVPPAWQSGPITPGLLAACGLSYQLGLTDLQTLNRAPRPLAVWSWDCGRFAALGLAGEALGTLRHLQQPTALPCIVLHPRDLQRGYLDRALHLVRKLLSSGWQPITPGALVDQRF